MESEECESEECDCEELFVRIKFYNLLLIKRFIISPLGQTAD